MADQNHPLAKHIKALDDASAAFKEYLDRGGPTEYDKPGTQERLEAAAAKLRGNGPSIGATSLMKQGGQ